MNEFLEILAHKFELPLSNPVLVFSLILLIILISPILLKRLNVPGFFMLFFFVFTLREILNRRVLFHAKENVKDPKHVMLDLLINK